jgi:hypothetical protein
MRRWEALLLVVTAVAIAIGIAAISTAALGAEPAPHSIPWFEARPGELQRWLRACQDDHRLARRAVCDNAQAAAARRMGRPGPHRRRDPVGDMLNDPSFWADNPYAREQTLRACRERGPGSAMYLAYCGPAMRGTPRRGG